MLSEWVIFPIKMIQFWFTREMHVLKACTCIVISCVAYPWLGGVVKHTDLSAPDRVTDNSKLLSLRRGEYYLI